jgi:hypothetical protein
MKHVKKITVVTVFAILISFFSLSVSIGALGTANAFKGSSIENKKIWEVNIRDISTMAVSSNYVSISKEPSMIDNAINYSLTLSNVNDYAQFQFNINNSGNIGAKVKNIVISGLEEYEQYVDVSISNIAVGDLILPETISNIVVVTSYKEQLYDVNMWPQVISLENINILIEFESIE